MEPRKARLHHQVRARPFFRVRHLEGDHGGDFRVAHSPPAPYPCELHCAWRGDNHYLVHQPVAPGFEEQRDIQHGCRGAASAGLCQEPALCGAHHGVEDVFQRSHCLVIREYLRAERGAVQHAVVHGAGEGFGDGGQGAAMPALQAMHGGVRVEHRQAGAAECLGGGGFAHADTAGEADDFHARALPFRDVGGYQGGDRLVHHRRYAEPGGEAGDRLVQQHAEPAHGAQAAGGGGGEQRRG
jgi:hypothetical protein